MIFDITGKCTLRVEANSFEQADLKAQNLSGVDLFRVTPEYMVGNDDTFTFVCTFVDIEREVIRKIS